jgi:hypothetical protein
LGAHSDIGFFLMPHSSAWAGQVGATDRETIFGLRGPVASLEEIVSSLTPLGAIQERVVTRFKPDGNRIETSRYSETGEILSRDEFTYDKEGRRGGPRFYAGVENRLDRFLEFTYDDTGRRRAFQRQFTADRKLVFTLRFSYDQLGRRVKMEWVSPEGSVFRSYELTYDAAGNRTGMHSRLGDGQTEWRSRSRFDRLGRMTFQSRLNHRLPASVEVWRYGAEDEAGNWTRAIRWRLERVRWFIPLPTRTRIERRLTYFPATPVETR